MISRMLLKRLLFLTLGILASPVRAELILSDAQMDNVTAGAFIVGQDPSTLLANPDILVGLQNGQQVLLLSVDNGNTYSSSVLVGPADAVQWVPDEIAWTSQELYISTTQGYAAGVLIGPQGQSWDGGYILPPDYVLTPDVVRGAPVQISDRTNDTNSGNAGQYIRALGNYHINIISELK